MADKSRSPHAYTPDNLGRLLALYKREPNAQLFAGGTYILGKQREKQIRLNANVLYLGNIDELKRIGRTDRFLEIGATVPINQILVTGRHILPRVLYTSLKQMATPLVKNRATLGGNICIRDQRMDPFAVLQLLNVTVELRSSEGSRWLPLKKAVDENGTLLIHPGEVLTRIRIPFETWDIQEYVKVGRNSLEDEQHLSFCSLIKTQKEVINEFKFAFSVLGTVPIRDWSIEAELIGKRIPLTEKNYKLIMDLCDKLLENHREQMSGFQRDRARHIMKHFLLGLSSE